MSKDPQIQTFEKALERPLPDMTVDERKLWDQLYVGRCLQGMLPNFAALEANKAINYRRQLFP